MNFGIGFSAPTAETETGVFLNPEVIGENLVQVDCEETPEQNIKSQGDDSCGNSVIIDDFTRSGDDLQ